MRQAIEFCTTAGIGKVYMARGLCFKPRPSIGRYPDGPMQPGEKYRLNVETKARRADLRRRLPAKVNYDLWLGPAPKRPFNRNRFHYNWHWHWDYGNGDTGNQGPHQFDMARWGLGKDEHPVKIRSVGGYYGAEDRRRRRTCRPRSSPTPTARCWSSPPAAAHQRRGHAEDRQPLLRHQGLAVDRRRRRKWQSYLGRKDEKGPGAPHRPGRAAIPSSSRASRGRTTRTSSTPSAPAIPPRSRARVQEGHLSSALPHLANISYRVGRALTFDPKKEKFVGDTEADATDAEYRAPFMIPEKV